MISIFFDIVGFFSSYFILMFFYEIMTGERSRTYFYRILGSCLAYMLMFFFIDYHINVVFLIIYFYQSPSIGTAGAWMSGFVFTGLLLRVYVSRPEKLNIDEMKNFIRALLKFENYFRLRDVDTQEMIGKHKMKVFYEEVHGKPFTEDVIKTPFDEVVTTFKKAGTEKIGKKSRYYPPEYADHMKSLKTNRRADVSASFRFELMKSDSHSFLQFMDRFHLDSEKSKISFEIIFPLDKKITVDSPAAKTKLIEQVYESLQHFIAQEWISLYFPFFNMITVVCKRTEFSEENLEIYIPLMTFTISVKNLQLRARRITTRSEIEKIAQIQFH